MSEIISVSNVTDWRPLSSTLAAYDQTVDAPEIQQPQDTVEVSPFGKMLAEVGGSSFRAARLAAIRGEIDAGTFETPERLDGAVSRLIDILG